MRISKKDKRWIGLALSFFAGVVTLPSVDALLPSENTVQTTRIREINELETKISERQAQLDDVTKSVDDAYHQLAIVDASFQSEYDRIFADYRAATEFDVTSYPGLADDSAELTKALEDLAELTAQVDETKVTLEALKAIPEPSLTVSAQATIATSPTSSPTAATSTPTPSPSTTSATATPTPTATPSPTSTTPTPAASSSTPSATSTPTASPSSQPNSCPVQGNTNSNIYHVSGQRWFNKMNPSNVRCFESESAAQAAGFRRSQR